MGDQDTRPEEMENERWIGITVHVPIRLHVELIKHTDPVEVEVKSCNADMLGVGIMGWLAELVMDKYWDEVLDAAV